MFYDMALLVEEQVNNQTCAMLLSLLGCQHLGVCNQTLKVKYRIIWISSFKLAQCLACTEYEIFYSREIY